MNVSMDTSIHGLSHPFKTQSGWKRFDGRQKFVDEVSLYVIGSEWTDDFSVPTDKNLKVWSQQAIGRYIENKVFADINWYVFFPLL